MIPTNEDFQIYQGNTKRVTFKTTGITDINKVDKIEWYVVYDINDDDVILQKTYPNGGIDIQVDSEDSSIHNISFVLTESDTLDLEPREYEYELKLQDSDVNEDFISTISRGIFTIKDSVNF